ncbi:MAG: lysyl oxidase family protein [Gammaproteobacteria bacterium]
MNNRICKARTIFFGGFRIRIVLLGWAMVGAVLYAPTASAQEVVDRLPNLRVLPASDVALVGTKLRFSTTSWNNGSGPLELVAGPVDTGSGKQQVYQRVYLSDGGHFDHFAGWVQWHQAHNHFHFDDYALYTLQPVNAPGGSIRTSSKTTFCIMDTDKIDGSLPGAPVQSVYNVCGNQIQGMSVGWGDTYGYWLAGQDVDFTGNPYGMYQLKIEVDPKKLLLEANENDNVSCVLLDIQDSGARVLDNSGSCNLVRDITPKLARRGETLTVEITGYGFTPSSTVTFEGGTGPRPVATVISVEDTSTVDTITADVTVPYKKQLGRNPLWDVKVSTGGILPDAFTVTK